MLRLSLSLCALLLLGSGLSADDLPPAKPAPPKDPKALEKDASYAIGVSFGKNLKRDKLDLDLDKLVEGLRDVLGDGKPKMTDPQVRQVLQQYGRLMQQRAIARNKAEGAAFLAANKKKKGVVTLKSGLQYKVVKRGTGATPQASDRVRTHYEGTLIDGTIFDSSYKRGQPAQFAVNGVIKGWTEALQLMKVGDQWELYIPSELAYGASGSPPTIGPHSTLVFKIELIEVVR